MPNGPIAILGGSTGNGPQSIGNGKSIPWFVTRYLRRNEATTDYGVIPAITLSGDFVIEFEVLTAVNTNQVMFGDNVNTHYFNLSEFQIEAWIGNVNSVFSTGSISLASGILHKIKYVKTGSSLECFLDGVSLGTRSCGSYSGAFTPKVYGSNRATPFFSGIIANLKIYDDGVLVRDYPINDNSNTLKDLASGQNGSIVNGTVDQWKLYQKQPTGEWLGPDIAPNYLNLSNWANAGANASVVGSELYATAVDGSSDRVELYFPAIVGTRYNVEIGARPVVGTNQAIQQFVGWAIPSTPVTTKNVYKFNNLFTTSSPVTVRAYASVSGGNSGDILAISSLSIKEVLNVA